jgi:hypothetical protein
MDIEEPVHGSTRRGENLNLFAKIGCLLNAYNNSLQLTITTTN